MSCRTKSVAISMSLLIVAAASAAAQEARPVVHREGALVTAPVAKLTFSPIQPPGFDEGMEVAVVSGDPSVADQPYVIRLRFRDGYRFPPHFHPVTENLTVLEGSFLLAMGEKADEAQLQTYQPGDFLFIEGNHPHFGGAKGQTVIQLHGTGPFAIIVVGSPEDRRK